MKRRQSAIALGCLTAMFTLTANSCGGGDPPPEPTNICTKTTADCSNEEYLNHKTCECEKAGGKGHPGSPGTTPSDPKVIQPGP